MKSIIKSEQHDEYVLYSGGYNTHSLHFSQKIPPSLGIVSLPQVGQIQLKGVANLKNGKFGTT